MAMAGSATARPWVWNARMPHAKRRGTRCCRRFLGCGRSTRMTCLCEASRLAVGNKARTQHSKRAGGRRAQKRAPNQEPGAAVGRPVGPGQSSAAGSGAKQSNAQTLERGGGAPPPSWRDEAGGQVEGARPAPPRPESPDVVRAPWQGQAHSPLLRETRRRGCGNTPGQGHRGRASVCTGARGHPSVRQAQGRRCRGLGWARQTVGRSTQTAEGQPHAHPPRGLKRSPMSEPSRSVYRMPCT